MPPARPWMTRNDDQLDVGLREAAGEAREREERDADDEDPLVAEPVADAAGRDEREAVGEGVAGDDPREGRLGGVDARADRRQGDVDDRRVEQRHRDAEDEDGEREPGAPRRRPRWRTRPRTKAWSSGFLSVELIGDELGQAGEQPLVPGELGAESVGSVIEHEVFGGSQVLGDPDERGLAFGEPGAQGRDARLDEAAEARRVGRGRGATCARSNGSGRTTMSRSAVDAQHGERLAARTARCPRPAAPGRRPRARPAPRR